MFFSRKATKAAETPVAAVGQEFKTQ